jgi:hypothetical protein
MKNSKKEGYDAVFEALKARWKRLGLKPKFVSIGVDFEEAEMKSAQAAFGVNVYIVLVNVYVSKFRNLEGPGLLVSLRPGSAPLPEESGSYA